MKASKTGKNEDMPVLQRFLKSDEPAYSYARDILWIILVVGGFALVLFLFSGTWPAVVAVESESMVPNMNVGDLVFVVAPDRYGELATWNESISTGYGRFNEYPDLQGDKVYGDVIIYRPNGRTNVDPIIHRAVTLVNNSDYPELSNSGYITKGDNNEYADQAGSIAGIGRIEPVKEEWVVGKALFSIPLLGYAPLHVFELAAIVIILMIAHELYIRSKEKKKAESKKSVSKVNTKERKNR